jgi:hypothetical protein
MRSDTRNRWKARVIQIKCAATVMCRKGSSAGGAEMESVIDPDCSMGGDSGGDTRSGGSERPECPCS